MSLKPFTYPFPETRFLHSGSNVYKFKIRYGSRVRREDIENKEVIVQELETLYSLPQGDFSVRKNVYMECGEGPKLITVQLRLTVNHNVGNREIFLEMALNYTLKDSLRVVLGNLDNLQPFTTKHFIVFPYKSRWERVSHLKFRHGEIALVPYPFVLTLYVEMKWFHETLTPGKPINNSALGLVLTEREAAGAMRKKRQHTEVSSSPSRPGLDRAKVRTSSQGPSKKKLLVETSRECRKRRMQRGRKGEPAPDREASSVSSENQSQEEGEQCFGDCEPNPETKTQQECQETSAFGVTDVQEQDSRWEDSQAGDIILPGQQSSPSPPKGPADLGTSGFFGFLSSLFPFRYFFRRSSQ